MNNDSEKYKRAFESIETILDDLITYMKDDSIYENGNDELAPFFEYGVCFAFTEKKEFKDEKLPYWYFQISYGGPTIEIRFLGHCLTGKREQDNYKDIELVELVYLDWGNILKVNLTNTEISEWLINQFFIY
jgi:hypothetical protein